MSDLSPVRFFWFQAWLHALKEPWSRRKRDRIARSHVRALLRRQDDRLLDDMGTTRDALRRRYDLWDEP